MSRVQELQKLFDKFSKSEYSVPYILHLHSDKQQFIYIGTSHTFDQSNSQIIEIHNQWNIYLAQTAPKNRLVLTEGGVRDVSSFTTEREVVAELGEIGLVTWLARNEGVEIFSPEPNEEEWFRGLVNQFGYDATLYYDFARVCYQWNKTRVDISFEAYMEPFLLVHNGSVDKIKRIHHKLFRTEFNPNNIEFYAQILNPNSSFSLINKISYFDDTGYRDLTVLQNIEKYLSEGKDIFAIYGLQHVVIQEKFLRKYFSR